MKPTTPHNYTYPVGYVFHPEFETQFTLLPLNACRLSQYASWEPDGPKLDRVIKVVHRATFDSTFNNVLVTIQLRYDEIKELERRLFLHPWDLHDPVFHSIQVASRRLYEREWEANYGEEQDET